MITFEQVVENELLSEDIVNILPKECECGAKIAFTDTLVNIYCTNPKCHHKIGARLEDMAKKLRGKNGETCEGWGNSTCVQVCKDFKMVSPYQVFQLEQFKGKYTNVAAFDKKVDSICNPALRQTELWKVVELGGLPNIGSIAYKLFNGYNSIEEAYADFEKWEVPFIANKLGIKNNDSSVLAVSVYNTLMEYKSELLYAEKLFDVYKPSGETLYIAITGGVNGYKNKSEFIDYINKRYNGAVNAMLMNSVSSQVQILVADGDTGSNKFKTAKKINDKHIEKLINSGVDASTFNTFKSDKDIHTVGEAIFVGDSDEVLERLDRVYLR